WSRPGFWEDVLRACEAGVWWVELHGLHHLPESAWLAALHRGDDDARRAIAQQSPVCAAVEASGEYDPSEPLATRRRNLERAVARFGALVGRAPRSFCPPDYRWDESLESEAERHGVTTFQGKAEQAGRAFLRLRRLRIGLRWPHTRGARFYMPPRIAFEPCGGCETRARAAGRAVPRRRSLPHRRRGAGPGRARPVGARDRRARARPQLRRRRVARGMGGGVSRPANAFARTRTGRWTVWKYNWLANHKIIA